MTSADVRPGRRRVVLFLQGPASPFLQHVGISLARYGVQVRRILLCLGDRVFWSLPADWFLGKFEDWPGFLETYIKKHAVTDIVMLGDGRPYHARAIRIAGASGVRVHVLEHGYLRPDRLTIEPDGMSSYSRFPRNPEHIEQIAGSLADPAHARTGSRWKDSFLRYAIQDLAFNVPNALLGWIFHRRYRPYAAASPFVEYGAWSLKLLGLPWTRWKARRLMDDAAKRATKSGRTLFLFPLQLSGDYQIRIHAAQGDQFKLVSRVIESFARHACGNADLLFKIHPLDNGLFKWGKSIRGIARRLGVAGRVYVLDGGDLDAMLGLCAGVVTINSTVGLTALRRGLPVIALGNAIYDIDGMTCQGRLSDFWRDPAPPRQALVEAFIKVLRATSQVEGSFVAPLGVRTGAANVADRIAHGYPVLDELPCRPREIEFRTDQLN